MYLADIAYLEWEIKRLRRGKIAMLNTAFRKALEKLLTELMRAPHQESWEVDDKASAIAFDWFSSAKTKKRVAALLASYGLDTTAIEAKVLQVCSSRLAEFDHLLASAESRRLKAVRALTEYRALLARHLVATGNVTESDGARAKAPRAVALPTTCLHWGTGARIRARLNNSQFTQNRCELPQCGKEHRPAQRGCKARTRRNAERHGLAARIVFDADQAVRIETLAREIAGAVSDYTSIASPA